MKRQHTREEVAKLKRQLRRNHKAWDAATDVPIYCAKVEGSYEERTPYMNGWNACAMHAIELVQQALKRFKP